ncbi:MAG: polysulfide reductase NrfD, partial [Deltaproteobacteria bacterium]|nr:polysulfide reductase NrfD [Deltaproteobacteria bacterium]
MQLISPMKQRVWHWPAVANFFLGGMAGGLYLIQSVLTHFVDMAKGNSLFVKFTLVASALILLGLLLVGLESGRPMRGLYVFREPRRSWMSREAWAAVVFVPAAILNCIIPNPVVLSLAIFAAFFFMVSQGLIVYSARGVTAWNVPIIPLFFISSGLATGSGLFLLLTTVADLGLNKTVV